jgi:hypothetical protein
MNQQEQQSEKSQQSTEGPIDSPAVPTTEPSTVARSPEEQPEKAPATPPAPPPPLVMVDGRFTTMRRMQMKTMRDRFIKLFKKTSDKAVRILPDEMAVFWAVSVFEELWSIRAFLHETNPNPAVHVEHDPFHIFLQVLHELIGRAMGPEVTEEKKDQDANVDAESPAGGVVQENPENPAGGSDASSDTGAEIRSSTRPDTAPSA